ncbi:hypothetical protein EYF80_034526 [Liparis tanakae]|uniref:Uncharacterized protein n=1 Tax=Liparis tanakae TaxID=230148 RepID=A0A4Z2GPU8_9TELE|nr:hypothetical protein EYF80_034526 [Liparis tanakae]
MWALDTGAATRHRFQGHGHLPSLAYLHPPVSVDRNICHSFTAPGPLMCFHAEINRLSNLVGLFGYNCSDRI